MMKAPEKNVIRSITSASDSDPNFEAAGEPQSFLYLYKCYERFVLHSSNQKVSLVTPLSSLSLLLNEIFCEKFCQVWQFNP